MKKVMLFVAILSLLSLSSFSQSQTEKSIVIQNTDSIQQQKISNIEKQLTSFYKESRQSQVFIFAGAAIATAGLVWIHPAPGEINIVPLVGYLSLLVGVVLYFDSYRFLNINKKKKVKIENYNYSW